jgi:hypothetical protein
MIARQIVLPTGLGLASLTIWELASTALGLKIVNIVMIPSIRIHLEGNAFGATIISMAGRSIKLPLPLDILTTSTIMVSRAFLEFGVHVHRYTFAVLLFGFTCLGCATDEFGRCDNLEVTATSGPQPTFQWSAAECGVYRLTVEQAGAIRWDVTMSQLSNEIHSPVDYCVVPFGAQGSQLVPLSLGPYKVSLVRLNDKNQIELAGEANFSNQ